MKGIIDLHLVQEDKRIEAIAAMAARRPTDVMIDNEAAKIARYKEKLNELGIVELHRVKGPVKRVITLTFGKKTS